MDVCCDVVVSKLATQAPDGRQSKYRMVDGVNGDVDGEVK
jgi:hypothetical protein